VPAKISRRSASVTSISSSRAISRPRHRHRDCRRCTGSGCTPFRPDFDQRQVVALLRSSRGDTTSPLARSRCLLWLPPLLLCRGGHTRDRTISRRGEVGTRQHPQPRDSYRFLTRAEHATKGELAGSCSTFKGCSDLGRGFTGRPLVDDDRRVSAHILLVQAWVVLVLVPHLPASGTPSVPQPVSSGSAGPRGAALAGSAPQAWGGRHVSIVVVAAGSVITVCEIGESGASLRINEVGNAGTSPQVEGLR
jgi:hypothetical protein